MFSKLGLLSFTASQDVAPNYYEGYKLGCYVTPIEWISLLRFSADNRADPAEVMILDLQNTRLGRPGCELTYFFCSSISYELRKDHLDELLRFYYDEFSEQLIQLGGDVFNACYTFEELKKDFDDCYSFGFVMGCLHSHVRN